MGHALLCIGRESIGSEKIGALMPYVFYSKELQLATKRNELTFYDYDSIKKDFVFVDDNMPVYQLASLDEPAIHYEDSRFHKFKIEHIIVPLYPKIYLEAYEAKNFIVRFLINGPHPLACGSEVLVRTYLTSSRSYKDKLAVNKTFSPDVRDLILETVMPRFVWVGELSSKDLIAQKKANGLIILDATEAN